MPAQLAALSLSEGEAAVARWSAERPDPATAKRAETRSWLEELHRIVIRMTPQAAEPPAPVLATVSDLVAATPPQLVDGLSPRPRALLRLLLAGQPGAAWAVAIDNAVGAVQDAHDISTASGAAQSVRRLPLTLHVEPPTVYAWLPGFRDPRYDAPDACYDITDRVRLSHHLDAVQLDGGGLTFGGRAVLEPFGTRADEAVTLVVSPQGGGAALTIPGRRARRSDLVTGTGEGLLRRAWAGWSARVDLSRIAAAGPQDWTVALRVEQAGIAGSAQLGRSVHPLLERGATARAGRRAVSVQLIDNQVRLRVEPRPPLLRRRQG